MDFGRWTLDSILTRTSRASAADGFDDVLKILPAVVISDLFAGSDVSLRPDPDSAVFNYCLGIGAT